jgi:hypothetical protein
MAAALRLIDSRPGGRALLLLLYVLLFLSYSLFLLKG